MKIRKWLSAPDPSANYRSGLRIRQADTGSWFLESEQYTHWKVSSSSFLWLFGIPGCGKTILASTIIEDCLKHCAHDPTKAVAYFFFDFNNPQKQSSERMIRSLITQFSERCIKIPWTLESLFASLDEGQRQPPIEALLQGLRQIIEELPATFIVLDALDECADRDQLLTTIDTITGWQVWSLHVLATSRRERDIEVSFESLVDDHNTVQLSSALVDQDIQKYVRQRLLDNKSLRKWQSCDIREEIETTLMSGAHGMQVCKVGRDELTLTAIEGSDGLNASLTPLGTVSIGQCYANA